MKIDEKRMIQITRGLNGEVEKREDLRNEKNQTSDGLPNTPLQATDRCAAPLVSPPRSMREE